MPRSPFFLLAFEAVNDSASAVWRDKNDDIVTVRRAGKNTRQDFTTSEKRKEKEKTKWQRLLCNAMKSSPSFFYDVCQSRH